MSLRFVYGEPGSGKTDFCMKEAASCGKNAIIIVPEQYSHTAEKRLANILGVFGAEGADVKSFGQLSRELLKTKNSIALRHIDKGGKTMLIYKILYSNKEKLTLLRGSEANKASELQRLISEFKRYGVLCENLEKAAASIENPRIKAKLSDAGIIFGEYENALSGKFIDGDDNLTRASYELQNGEYLRNKEIYLTDFSSFTPSELLCIKQFLRFADRVTAALSMPQNPANSSRYLPLLNTRDILCKMADELSVGIDECVTMSFKRTKNRELDFLSENFFEYSCTPYEDDVHNISLFEAQNPYTEIMHAASEIRRLCSEKSYMFRDIGVLCSDAETYLSYAKIIFPKYDIPFFPDSKVKVLSHPVISFVLSALEIISSNYAHEPLLRYAKSEFSGAEPEKIDVLENYVLAAGIRSDAWKSDLPWEIRTDFYSENETPSEEELNELQDVNQVRAELMAPIRALDKALKDGRTVNEKCKALYAFTEDVNLCEKTLKAAERLENQHEPYTAAEYRAVYNKLIDALDEANEALGEDKVSVKHFYEILSIGLAEFEIGLIPSLADGVRFGDIARLRSCDVKALFILGANDSLFPVTPPECGFFSDSDRIFLSKNGLSLAPDGMSQVLEGDHLLSEAFAAPSEKLFISFSGSDFEGKTKRAAMCVSRIEELFPRIPRTDDIIGTADPSLLPYDTLRLKQLSAPYSTVYGNETSDISKDTMHKILGDDLVTSVSRLETFAACPFSYFMQYTLKAKERKSAVLKASDAGSFMHSFIEIFSRRLKENETAWDKIDDNYINSEADEIMRLISPRLNEYVMGASPRTAHLFVRLKNCLKSSVRFISNQISLGSFVPTDYEVTFDSNGKIKPLKIPLSGGGSISLTGKIDRVDMLSMANSKDRFVRITDYKSGAQSFNLLEIFTGVSLQLGVYLTAYCESTENTKPAGMLYFKLDDPIVETENTLDTEAIMKKRIKALKISGILLDDKAVLEEMDKTNSFDYLPLYLNKDGSLSSRSSITTAKGFETLSAHIKRTVSALAQDIYRGKTDISPYKDKCDYCSFAGVCRFDGNNCRNFEKISDEEIWKEMENGNVN